MKTLKRIALAAWAVAVLTGIAAKSSADDRTGIKRISDRTVISEPNYLPASHSHHYGYARGCETGGQGWHGHQYGLVSPINGYPMHPYVKGAVWLPSIHAVQRDPVLYQRWWPHRWYGMPGGGIAADAQRAPVVYIPTDTTQLGYYNQRVPYWTPRPGMYPTAAPDPTMLHNYTRPPLGHRWYYGSHYWGVNRNVQHDVVYESHGTDGENKPSTTPKKNDRPSIPNKLDKSASAPQVNPQN